jgi:hypothetical protein
MLGMTLIARSEDITLRKANGEVFVRHGVTETWTKVAVGDVLKPDDTMKTGKKGSALLVVNGTKKMMLPAEVIVDVADNQRIYIFNFAHFSENITYKACHETGAKCRYPHNMQKNP